jgi:hypothetical protein
MQQQVELETFDCLRRLWCVSLLDSKKFDVFVRMYGKKMS